MRPTALEPGLPKAPTGMKLSRCITGVCMPRISMEALPTRSPGWLLAAVPAPLPEPSA